MSAELSYSSRFAQREHKADYLHNGKTLHIELRNLGVTVDLQQPCLETGKTIDIEARERRLTMCSLAYINNPIAHPMS
jgi:hypothetical protein